MPVLFIQSSLRDLFVVYCHPGVETPLKRRAILVMSLRDTPRVVARTRKTGGKPLALQTLISRALIGPRPNPGLPLSRDETNSIGDWRLAIGDWGGGCYF